VPVGYLIERTGFGRSQRRIAVAISMRRVNQLIALGAVFTALAVAWMNRDGAAAGSGVAPLGTSIDASAAIVLVGIIAAVNFFAMLVSIAVHHAIRSRAGLAVRGVLFQPLRTELAWAAVPIVILLATAIPAATGWVQSEPTPAEVASGGAGSSE